MPDEAKSDIVMQFYLNGKALLAECASEKQKGDDFMDGFNPAPTPSDYSDFFNVTKFDFGFEVKDQDASTSKASKANQAGTSNSHKEKSTSGKQSFASWRSATTDDVMNKKLPYPVECEPISFTRPIDAVSPIFFECCTKNFTFDKAVLVKRVSVDAYRYPMGFLRLTFNQVLIVGIDWDDGDVLNETCKFICQTFKAEYKAQKFSGDLIAPKKPAQWDWRMDAKPKEG